MARKPDPVGLLVGLAVGAGVGIALWRHFNPCPCPTGFAVPPTVETGGVVLPASPGHLESRRIPLDVPVEGLRRIPRQIIQTCDMYGRCSPAVVGRSFDSPYTPVYTPTPSFQPDKYDRYGCYTPGGFQWCDSMKRCVRPWEQPCY